MSSITLAFSSSGVKPLAELPEGARGVIVEVRSSHAGRADRLLSLGVTPGARVLAAVSGGADSVCLLDLLRLQPALERVERRYLGIEIRVENQVRLLRRPVLSRCAHPAALCDRARRRGRGRIATFGGVHTSARCGTVRIHPNLGIDSAPRN